MHDANHRTLFTKHIHIRKNEVDAMVLLIVCNDFGGGIEIVFLRFRLIESAWKMATVDTGKFVTDGCHQRSVLTRIECWR